MFASTLSAADTDRREAVWLRRAATRHGGCVASEAHRAALGGMMCGIRADHSCARYVVADSPWRMHMCCARGAHRRLCAWPRQGFDRVGCTACDEHSYFEDLHITTQAHASRHAHMLPHCLTTSALHLSRKYLDALPFFQNHFGKLLLRVCFVQPR